MASSIQRRRGTTSDHATFTGAVGEITIDTTKDTVVVHDGAVVGGVPLLREDGSNSSLALGSQGVPSLKFSGDPNTGIYSPGADQLAVATNGTGRLFVNANGQVGINGAPPAWASSSSISVNEAAFSPALSYVGGEGELTHNAYYDGAWKYSGTGYQASRIQLGVQGAISFLNTPTIGTAGGAITWQERLRITSTGTLNFRGAGTAGSTQAVSFDGSAPVNSLVIDSSGRLGIGTSDVRGTLGLQHGNTSPQGLNDVAIDALRISQGAGGIVAIRTTQYDAANQPAAGDTQFFNLYFNGSTYNYYERMRIRADGCVGIGTTPASGTTLHVDATGGATVRVSRISASAGAYGQLEHDGTNTTLTSTAATAFVNNGTEKARIRSDGMFEVKGAGVSGSSPAFSVNGSAPANSAIIDTSGRLLVGTPNARTIFENGTASARVQVEGTDNSTSRLTVIRNGGGGGITLAGTAGASVGSIDAVANNATLGEIAFAGSDGTDFVNAANISVYVDGTATINAGSFVASRRYKIATVGTTDFTAIGASANTVGVIFTATGVGAGTGTATSEPYANSMPGRLVFSTTADGGSSPTERMRITSGGLVGIGTSSPISKLGVIDSSAGTAATIRNENATNGYGLAIETEGTSSTRYALILRNLAGDVYYGGVSTATGQVGYWGIGVSPTGTLGNRLTVGGSASIGSGSYLTTAAPANGLIVQGSVGIGTSEPATNFQVNAASDVTIALSNSSSVTSGNRGSISCYNSAVSSVGTIRFAAVTDNVGTEIQFFTRPAAGLHTQTMTLDSAGRLGIGTTSPTTGKLTLVSGIDPGTTAAGIAVSLEGIGGGTATSQYGIRVTGGGYNNSTNIYGVHSALTQQNLSPTYGGYFSATGTYTQMYGIYGEATNSDGNAGNNVYAGYFKTNGSVAGTGGTNYGIRVENAATNGGTSYGAYLSTVAGATTVIPLRIDHAGSEKARIDSSGRLLVGTTSDANGGQVEAKTAMVVSGNPAYDKKAFIAQIPYATTNITSSLLAGFDGNIHGVDLGYRYNGTGYDLCFATNSTIAGSPTERMKIKSDGDVTVTNGSVRAKSFISNNQNAELLGYAYSSNGAFIDLSSITAANFRILEIFGYVNPNAAGSSYVDPIHMYVYHGNGWNGSQLTSYIYSRHVAPIRTQDIFPSGGTAGNVCDAVWYNGSVESDSCIAESGSHNVRLKITNWSTSIGSSFNVRVFKRL